MRVCSQCRSIFRADIARCAIDGALLFEQDEDPLVGSVLDGRYAIVECLGSGAMATVYRARHVALEFEYAIKVLAGDYAAQAETSVRFRREALWMSRMQHPNVVAVRDFGTTPHGLTFLVMEYVNGQTLREVIDERGPLVPPIAARLMRQIASGLQEAHRWSYVHRDLKPSNIMVAAGIAKIFDFGLVGLEGAHEVDVSREGYIMGTPSYMAPEQASNEEIGPPADLYALGVIGYEMLTGRVPYRGRSITETLVMHITSPVPDPGVDHPLGALVQALMAKTAGERPSSADEVVTRLDGLLAASTAAAESLRPFDVRRPSPSSVAGGDPAPRRDSASDVGVPGSVWAASGSSAPSAGASGPQGGRGASDSSNAQSGSLARSASGALEASASRAISTPGLSWTRAESSSKLSAGLGDPSRGGAEASNDRPTPYALTADLLPPARGSFTGLDPVGPLLKGTDDAASTPGLGSSMPEASAPERRRLGSILIEAAYITQQDLEAALDRAGQTNVRLGRALVDQGSLTEAHLVRALARHIALDECNPALPVHPRVLERLPVEVAERHCVLPIALERTRVGRTLVLATFDPFDEAAEQAVRAAIGTGFGVRWMLATEGAIRAAITRHYAPQQPGPRRPYQAGGADLGVETHGPAPPAARPVGGGSEPTAVFTESVSCASVRTPVGAEVASRGGARKPEARTPAAARARGMSSAAVGAAGGTSSSRSPDTTEAPPVPAVAPTPATALGTGPEGKRVENRTLGASSATPGTGPNPGPNPGANPNPNPGAPGSSPSGPRASRLRSLGLRGS